MSDIRPDPGAVPVADLGERAPGLDGARIVVTDEDGTTVLSVHGDVDLGTARPTRASLLAAIEGAPGGGHTIDLHAVTFLDSSGLRCLSEVADAHPSVTFRRVPEPVRRLLEITGLLESFGLEPRA